MKRAFQKATLYIENLILKNLYTRSDIAKRVLALSKRQIKNLKGDIKMSELLNSLGNISPIKEEKVMSNMYSSPFETKDWWENGLSKDELEHDERYCEYWKIVVYRGNYSKRTKGQGYAVKVKSKIGDMIELTYLFDDFVNNFNRVCKSDMSYYGYLDSWVASKLIDIACFYKKHDMVGDEKNHVIVLDQSVDNALDILLDNVSANNLVDQYYNRLVEYIKENYKSFASRTAMNATPDVKAAWLDDDLYKAKYTQETLAIRDKELKNFIGRKETDVMLMKEIVAEFAERGYILPGKNFAKDITLSADAKDVRCYVVNINRDMLGI